MAMLTIAAEAAEENGINNRIECERNGINNCIHVFCAVAVLHLPPANYECTSRRQQAERRHAPRRLQTPEDAQKSLLRSRRQSRELR